MTDKKVKKIAFSHCIKIMWFSFLLFFLYEFSVIVFRTFTARVLGDFTNNILSLDYNTVMQSLGLLIILIILNIFLEPTLSIVRIIVHFKQSLKHHSEVVSIFLNKDYLKAKKIGAELAFRWEDDLLYYKEIILDLTTKPLIIIFSSILLSFYLFENIVYGFICIAASLIPVFITYFTRKKESKYRVQKSEYETKKSAYEIDMATQFVYLKTNKINNLFISKIKDLFRNYFIQTKEKDIKLKSKIEYLNKLSIYLSQLVVVLTGVYFVSIGQIQAGQIASYVIYLVPIQKIIEQISLLLKAQKMYKEYSNRIIPFYTYKENIDGKNFNDNINFISIENLSFKYDNDKKVIDNLDFHIKRGEKIKIAGNNGVGKSTLVKLISGLYSDYQGKIKINGNDCTSYNIDSIRKKISYIEQDPYFFAGTIEENLIIVNPNTNKEKAKEILLKLEFDKKLEDKIENGGINLSGGEKQKLSIARGIIKDSDVYIFDEPLNNLDKNTKEKLKEIECIIDNA